ncbi:C39 family peptidase [Nocardioides alcanivorans]|uniref:C39 family peptidase n=1 Tax=Nocardioides alcanivorans TaxID=2897352 RepID=UPI001F1813D6|nr:C39 family peptidase [Nocardioides alcanivorans]
MTSPRRLAAAALTLAVGTTLATPVVGTSSLAAAAPASGKAQITLSRWVGTDLSKGKHRGTEVRNGNLRIAKATGTEKVADPFGTKKTKTFERARWLSTWARPGFKATNLVPSWNAKARKKTLVKVEVRVASGSTKGSWDQVALWGFTPKGVRPHSGAAQPDDLARLATDTVLANAGKSFDRWQVRITLLRPQGTKRTPKLTSVNGVAADRTTVSTPVSATTMKTTRQLTLPTYSQMVHAGHHPEWGGGGEAWCSPTSMAMVVQHFGKGPKPKALAWEKGADARVDHAARHTYDHRYRGTGNWPFTTAYAGNYGLDGFVTRLRNLRDAEKLVKKGIPVVVSVKFGRGELTGAPISSTNGHLIVVSGFTAAGDVLVHDPAASRNAEVRRTYDRAQFERAWLRGSGGISYVVHPADKPLPKSNGRW